MFAVLEDWEGKTLNKMELAQFNRQSSLYEAITLSVSMLLLDGWNNSRTFIVFDEEEEILLKELGTLLGVGGKMDESCNPPHRNQVKAILMIFKEEIRLYAKLPPNAYIGPTYFPADDSRYLPAYGIVRPDKKARVTPSLIIAGSLRFWIDEKEVNVGIIGEQGSIGVAEAMDKIEELKKLVDTYNISHEAHQRKWWVSRQLYHSYRTDCVRFKR